MKRLTSLKSIFATRSDSEHEQAILRIVIVGLILGYMGLLESPREGWNAHEVTLVSGLAAFFVIAVAILVCICVWPGANVPRRLLGMVSDTGGATFYMCLAGEYGVSMIAVYLFVTFGNGFRFGRRHLFICQALSLVGLTGVLTWVPYWQGHRPAGIGLLIAMIVLPLYVSTLLKRIHEARAKAEEANRAKTAFLANMSHEMRTPLNGVVGLVDLMNATALSKQQRELMRLLRHSVSVLRSLVDDVLDISKIEAGRLSIEIIPFDLHSTINGLVQLLRPHANSKGTFVHALIDPDVDYRVQGDPHHIRQVLLNLLGNAIKFTERGEVTLGVTLANESIDGLTIRFQVRDTGIGISLEAQARIFERFVQADQSTTRRFGGTGLGTTIAKQLVELMGGTIGVSSVAGQGSTFWFEVPLLRGVEEPDETLSAAAGQQGTTLVVADEPKASTICSLVRSTGKSFQLISSTQSVGQHLDSLVQQSTRIDSVIVSASVDTACAAFSAAAQRLTEHPVALLLISDGPLSVVDKARIHSIKDARAIERDVSPRMLRNAIHAAVAGSDAETSKTVDLNSLLKRDRVTVRILVAEDNETNQTIIRELLETAGHIVLLASDGEEALDLYEQESPDVAILDFNMPQRTGCEVIQTIRLMEPTGTRMPTIILSASVTTEARDRAAKAGADDFVGKPFDAALLLQKIDRLAGQLPEGRRSAAQAHPIRRRTGTLTSSTPSSDDVDLIYVNARRVEELEDIARDADFVAELMRGFRSDSERLLARLRVEVRAENLEAIRDIAHALKGAAVGVGAQHLAARINEIEFAAEGNEGALRLRQLLSALELSYEKTVGELNLYLQMKHRVSL